MIRRKTFYEVSIPVLKTHENLYSSLKYILDIENVIDIQIKIS